MASQELDHHQNAIKKQHATHEEQASDLSGKSHDKNYPLSQS